METMEIPKVSSKEGNGIVNWFKSFPNRFDHGFLFVYILNYTNLGFMTFLLLTIKDYGKEYLHCTPEQLQTTNSILAIPWSFKIIYGLLSDTFPINGYKRKNYITLNSIIGFLSVIVLIPNGYFDNLFWVNVFLFIYMSTFAFNDILADSLMVIQSKKDL
jgi:MFS family permease